MKIIEFYKVIAYIKLVYTYESSLKKENTHHNAILERSERETIPLFYMLHFMYFSKVNNKLIKVIMADFHYFIFSSLLCNNVHCVV